MSPYQCDVTYLQCDIKIGWQVQKAALCTSCVCSAHWFTRSFGSIALKAWFNCACLNLWIAYVVPNYLTFIDVFKYYRKVSGMQISSLMISVLVSRDALPRVFQQLLKVSHSSENSIFSLFSLWKPLLTVFVINLLLSV